MVHTYFVDMFKKISSYRGPAGMCNGVDGGVPQAYGIVWKAIDKKTRETVALKKIFDAFQNATDAQVLFACDSSPSPNIQLHENTLLPTQHVNTYLIQKGVDKPLTLLTLRALGTG